MTSLTTTSDARGLKREISRVYSDVDAEGLKITCCYHPSNWRHTDRELAKYCEATKVDFEGSLQVSIGGPDATKVGTDFGVTMAAFMNPISGKVSVALPQVCVFVFPPC